ncbi:unnamed protein product [Darwinula stevensoni]|uniref:Uncharacterized protein n=1 Tax=Darwinula stevensoni TaxID=69355 RepID=A0A7R9A845_9CRUS|nr:unnamed protein product [Darwinula stevensoni]CAG0895278.1 unnamed protein product [Darwinula stevensoni]
MANFGVSSDVTGTLVGNTASIGGNSYAAFIPANSAGYPASSAGYAPPDYGAVSGAGYAGPDDYDAFFVPALPKTDLHITGKLPFLLGATSVGFLIAILVLVAKAAEEGSLDAPKKNKDKVKDEMPVPVSIPIPAATHSSQYDNYVRRKRAVDASPYQSEAHLARLTSIVLAALQSQECQQRMYCEMGSTLKTYGADRGIVFTLMDMLAPVSMKDSVKKIVSAANGTAECATYKCGSEK